MSIINGLLRKVRLFFDFYVLKFYVKRRFKNLIKDMGVKDRHINPYIKVLVEEKVKLNYSLGRFGVKFLRIISSHLDRDYFILRMRANQLIIDTKAPKLGKTVSKFSKGVKVRPIEELSSEELNDPFFSRAERVKND